MSGDNNSNNVTLREYFDRILEEKEKALQAALIAKEKALAAESAKTALIVTVAIFVFGSVGSILAYLICKK